MVGIDYGEDVSQAIAVIMRILENIEEVESEPTPGVLVNELAANTVNLEIRFWVDSRRAGFWLLLLKWLKQ